MGLFIFNNSVGFNYPDGQGITESRGFRIFSSISNDGGLNIFKFHNKSDFENNIEDKEII